MAAENLPAVQETQVWSLGREDPSEEEMATHSSILAWRIPWTEEPGGLQSVRSQWVGHDWVTNTLRGFWGPFLTSLFKVKNRCVPLYATKSLLWISSSARVSGERTPPPRSPAALQNTSPTPARLSFCLSSRWAAPLPSDSPPEVYDLWTS